MSTGEERAAAAAAPATTEAPAVDGEKLLKDVLKETERFGPEERAKDELKTVIEVIMGDVLKGTKVFDKNVTKTIDRIIDALDQKLSTQLAAVMHTPQFQKLEGTWRGLNYLVMNSETSATLKIQVFNVSKRALFNDVDKAVEFDMSQIFKKVYENEFGMPGGEPFGALIGDYEFTNHPEDIDLLSKMSNVAAAGFCPFVAAASPSLFGFGSWEELAKPRDLEKIFLGVEHIKWRSFRDSPDSRFVALTLPRVLARLPYGLNTKPIERFSYEEVDASKPVPHDHFSWMNAAYVMGTKMTDAFAKYGFGVTIRGAESGGKVEGLPAFIFTSDDGDKDLKCPTEIGITDRRENELSKLGFLPLSHYKNQDYAVFFGGQTVQKPAKYDRPDATANAAISARLPYIMATSRFSHYLKVMARDWIGALGDATTVEANLNRWIKNYVNGNPNAGEAMKAKYPLRDAKIVVQEIPGKPGSYNAICWLQPWLGLEELTTSMRLVARIPEKTGG
jgi:type VI secretion system protein ImpC